MENWAQSTSQSPQMQLFQLDFPKCSLEGGRFFCRRCLSGAGKGLPTTDMQSNADPVNKSFKSRVYGIVKTHCIL